MSTVLGLDVRGLKEALLSSRVGAVMSMPGPMLRWYQWTYFWSRVEYDIFEHTFSLQFYVFYRCIHLWNYHHNQGSEHMHHLPEFSNALGNASLHLGGAAVSSKYR